MAPRASGRRSGASAISVHQQASARQQVSDRRIGHLRSHLTSIVGSRKRPASPGAAVTPKSVPSMRVVARAAVPCPVRHGPGSP